MSPLCWDFTSKKWLAALDDFRTWWFVRHDVRLRPLQASATDDKR